MEVERRGHRAQPEEPEDVEGLTVPPPTIPPLPCPFRL